MIIYLEELDREGKNKFVRVSFWSILKANILSSLSITVGVYIAIFLLGLLLLSFGGQK